MDKKPYKHTKELTKNQVEVLYALSKQLMISQIAKYRKVARSSVYDIVNRLITRGLVEKIGRYYNPTEKGRKTLHSIRGLRYKLRFHNIAIKVKVLESPRNWELKRNKIITTNYANKRINLKNNYYDLINYGQMKLKTTSKSIIFYMPTIYSNSVDDGTSQVMNIFFDLIPKAEHLFKVKLIKNNKMNMTIISQEIARLQDALARIYRKEGNKLYITGDDGKIWLIADYSFSTEETETIHPIKSPEDMDTVHKFMNDLRKNPTTFSEVLDSTTELNQVSRNNTIQIKAILDNQKMLPEVLYGLKQQIHPGEKAKQNK